MDWDELTEKEVDKLYLIACVEDRMGMLFNHRRVSQDKAVCKNIIDMCGNQKIYIQEYSSVLFKEYDSDNIKIVKDFSSANLSGQFVFAENPESVKEEMLEKIILYRWNRKYPADQFFPIDLTGWKLSETDEFAGNSHEKITKEIYVRK